MQARHLVAMGRRKICLANRVDLPRLARVHAIREAAVRRELARSGCPAPLEMRLPCATTREIPDVDMLEEPMARFLEAHRGRFDGMIGDDPGAALAIRLMQAMGLRIPADVAVIGGGTTLLATYAGTPLTSVNAANDRAGARAFELLFDRIQGRAGDRFRRLTNPVRLMVRSSTANAMKSRKRSSARRSQGSLQT